MSEARRLGELLPGIIARAMRMQSFQALINDCQTPKRRKEMIMTARMGDLIDADECQMLIEIYELENA